MDTQDKILVLGLGNDVLTDDAVGLYVVREIGRRAAGLANVEVRETTEMGLALLDFIAGYRGLVLVDSIQTGRAPAGFIHEFGAGDLHRLPGPTPHFLGVGETLALGREVGMSMPEMVKIFAIEVQDPFTLGTEMTPVLQGVFPGIIERIWKEVLASAASIR